LALEMNCLSVDLPGHGLSWVASTNDLVSNEAQANYDLKNFVDTVLFPLFNH
jgi:hypothetical protein